MSLRAPAVAALVAALSLLAGCGADSAGDASASELADSDPASLTVAVAGDYSLDPTAKATLAAMGDSNPDLYLGLGDLSYEGPDSEDDFCALVHENVGEDAPFEIVAGNHEDDYGEDGFVGNFADCLPDLMDSVGRYGAHYYFDVGRLARFIMISPGLTVDGEDYFYGEDDDGSDTPELARLTDAIDGAREAGIDWVVVGMHKNCISTGVYYCDVHQDLFTRLIEEGVDVVVSGHDHSYQRSKQISAPARGCPVVKVDHYDPDCVATDGDHYERGAGTVFVVAASGGVEMYDIEPEDAEAGYFEAAMGANTEGSRHGFARMTITRERLAVEFVGSTPGTFDDSFEITGGG